MTREQCAQKAKDIMINKNSYGIYHKYNFDTYNYGENTPINSDTITDMPNATIILSEKVYGSLQAIQDVTNEERREVPFFLYGRETANNVIEFDDFFTNSNRDNRQSTEAVFDQVMIDDLERRVNNNLNTDFVVCHGHSHPAISEFYQNFSLGDFASYIEMNQNNSVFRNKQVELTSCLVTSTGDINFLFYDNISENFYRFTNVYARDNNALKPVNCYNLNQADIYYSTRQR